MKTVMRKHFFFNFATPAAFVGTFLKVFFFFLLALKVVDRTKFNMTG